MPPAKRAKRKRQDEQIPVSLQALIRSDQDLIKHTVSLPVGDLDTFFYISKDNQVFWGVNRSRLPRLAARKAFLKRIPDDRLFPKVPKPKDTHLTIAAPGSYIPAMTHVKCPSLEDYYFLDFIGSNSRARQLFAEAMIMEKIAGSKAHLHPNIIRYHGCRVHRQRITGLVFERLEYNLSQYVSQPGFSTLNKKRFIAKLKWAVSHIHSLGLAHNDICPNNIMVRETAGAQPEPVLIDFGSCAPFGSKDLLTFGTHGWFEKYFYTSEKKHDTYSLRKVEEWLNRQ
ncbi:kinase-like domain-containing protein [Aspergillus pseudodeflectus]|uniref:Kinase-like domain-containing protein n=1 Tax=Aspergillus pseudodeflectus TaxID=176178 RepID=A0ABR4JM41_9EURO